jgi:type I restriction enzyme M protein
LEATHRLDRHSAEVTAVWHLADDLRDGVRTEETMPLLLLLLAVMARASASEWQQVLNAEPDDLDEALRTIANLQFPFAEEVMPSDKLPAQSVARAIVTLSSLDRPRVGIMADALLEQAAKALGHRGGEFLSPESVRKLVVAIAEPTGTVYNPATGVGQLMIDGAKASSEPIHLVGQEINRRTWAMAQLNLAIHDVTAEVALGDVFAEDSYPQLRADRVVSFPPWGQKLPLADVLTDDRRWVWGEPGPNDGNAAWVQHCLAHLADSGRAVIVLPNGALFEGGRGGRIRQRIVKAGLLDAVLALPAGLFEWTAMPCSVLVFTKGRPNVDGKPAPTLMVDLTESVADHGGRSFTLDDDLIVDVAQLYQGWVDGQSPKAEYAAVASFDDLVANDFVIDPGRYLSLPQNAPDLEQVMSSRIALIDRLDSLTRASRSADASLKAILEAGR